MPSFEDHVKANVVLWVLGTLLSGFIAGIGAVKWSDERYKVEPISLTEKNECLKATAELAELRKLQKNAGANSSPQATEMIRSLNLRMATLTDENQRLRNSLTPSSTSSVSSPPLTHAEGASNADSDDFPKISLIVRYDTDRATAAKLVAQKLPTRFHDLRLIPCSHPCSPTPANMEYGDDVTPAMVYQIARLLSQIGIRDFAEPSINMSYNSRRTVTVYLE